MNFLSCYYFNAQSLGNKLNDLYDILHDGFYDIIAVSEKTWFKACDTNSLILDGAEYDVIRNDRRSRNVNNDTKIGREACIFIKTSIKHKIVILQLLII